MRRRRRVWLAVAIAAAACGGNPVLGEWEIDPDRNRRSVLLAVEAAELETLAFGSDAIASAGTAIPVTYEVEDDVVRVIRGDGRGEHHVEMLGDGRMRIELPIGVTAIYRSVDS